MVVPVDDNSFVLDASVVAAVLFPDEQGLPKAKTIQDIVSQTKNRLYSPFLLEYEVGNAIRSAVVQKRIENAKVELLVENFRKIPFIYCPLMISRVIELSLRHSISYYDATYLYVAHEKKATLISFDKKLVALNT